MRRTVKYLFDKATKEEILKLSSNLAKNDNYNKCQTPKSALLYLYRKYTDKIVAKKNNEPDKLTPTKVEIFANKFSYDDNSYSYNYWYRPKCVSKLLEDYYIKKLYTDIYKAWDKISPYLVNEDGNPVNLNANIKNNNNTNLYFVYDKTNERIKIGISKYPKDRIKTLSKLYDTKLEILYVHANAGFKLEKEIHKKFKKFNIKKEGIGREWFEPAEEIYQYIQVLLNQKTQY